MAEGLFSDAELTARYRLAYAIPDSVTITIDQVRQHWDLERELTERLLNSTPENRWATFEDAYTTLYSELSWLRASNDKPNSELRYREYAHLIGPGPFEIYEIGSGSGALLRHLSALGHRCKGTEITRERGAGVEGITWGNSDGVHLDEFEPPASYDVVISSQVIEHLHPDDLVVHLRAARAILRPGGRYLFDTPNRLFGPFDVSDVFGYETAAGMHLKEYTYSDIRRAAATAGYAEMKAILRLPLGLQARLPWTINPHSSGLYWRYLEFVERLLAQVSDRRRRKRVGLVAKAAGLQQNIFVELRRAD